LKSAAQVRRIGTQIRQGGWAWAWDSIQRRGKKELGQGAKEDSAIALGGVPSSKRRTQEGLAICAIALKKKSIEGEDKWGETH